MDLTFKEDIRKKGCLSEGSKESTQLNKIEALFNKELAFYVMMPPVQDIFWKHAFSQERPHYLLEGLEEL